jgi:hypothetical protein
MQKEEKLMNLALYLYYMNLDRYLIKKTDHDLNRGLLFKTSYGFFIKANVFY